MSNLSVIKKKIGRPKVGSTHVGVRVPPDLLAALDAFRAKFDPPPSRPEAIRQALVALQKLGGLD